MFFTSNYFIIFLTISVCVYWLLPKRHFIQNLFLICSSLTFYCYYEFQYVIILLAITNFAFFYSPLITKAKTEINKKILLVGGLAFYIGFLFYFKYLNFFGNIFNDVATLSGHHSLFNFVQIALPLGLSFYTLHMIGYTIDMYYESIDPVKNYNDFMASALFFPAISSGPIERQNHIGPQFIADRKFSFKMFEDGLNQIFYGVFKKVVIADSLSTMVDYVYAKHTTLPTSAILIGLVAYSIQLYFDFSGYSDIAIGLGKLFGIKLMTNFKYPYFSTSMAALWRRWHISLTTWIMTYIFNPISFEYRKKKKVGIFYAALVAFLISGLWHGANWTFVIWGLLHGTIIGFELVTLQNRTMLSKRIPTRLYNFFSGVITFIVWTLILTIFRSPTLLDTLNIYKSLIHSSWLFLSPGFSLWYILLATIIIIIEWFRREKEYGLKVDTLPIFFRFSIYLLLIIVSINSENFYHNKAFLYFNY